MLMCNLEVSVDADVGLSCFDGAGMGKARGKSKREKQERNAREKTERKARIYGFSFTLMKPRHTPFSVLRIITSYWHRIAMR